MMIRGMNFLDVPQWLRLLWNNREKNALSPAMLKYPTLQVAVAEKDGKPITYLPYHRGLVLDSLAFADNLPVKDRLDSVVQIVNTVIREAFASGVRECYYVSSDERTDEAAARHLGFEKLVVYRKVLDGASLDKGSDGVER